MSLQLPDVVKTYFADSNGGDAAQLASCFSHDATVCDERKTYEGIAEIKAWQQDARKAFAYQVHPLQALQEQNRLTVIANVIGNFPGSPIQLSHAFTLKGARIRSLEIAPC
ncbi:SnoaL-like domain protein [compost metagenome]